MKYELIKTDISAERTIMQDIVETYEVENEDGEIVEQTRVIGQEETDDYEVTITLGLHTADDLIPDFSKDIIVRSNNAQTGFQVDEQRNLAVLEYIQEINGMI